MRHRRERPRCERESVGQAHTEAVEHEPAGNLCESIRPSKRREDEPHQLRPDRKLADDRRLGDAHDGAIDVVQHRRKRDESEDAEARPRWPGGPAARVGV